MKILIVVIFLLFSVAHAKVVRYELIARKTPVNLSGKRMVNFAISLNGTIPAPTLEFTEGDEAEITLINEIGDDELSVHWHGILLDPYMDGVPYVNTPPIHPGEKYVFRFKLRQNGTFWYHSHTNVQEQKGVYGAIVIHPKKETIKADKEFVAVLSDWSDEDSKSILKNLRKDGDYYIYKKGTMRSWIGAIQKKKLKNFLYNEWTRMGGMDYSDVGYDAFLINGKKNSQGLVAHPGEKIRLRIINASASTYFHVSLAGLPMKIISLDGKDIKPTRAKEFLIGMAETYDVLFQIPDHKNFELKATAQDGTGSASSWIGMGDRVPAPVKEKPDLYMMMDHSMNHASMDHSTMNHESMDHSMMDHSGMHHAAMDADSSKILNSFDIEEAESIMPTSLPEKVPVKHVKLVLDGDMRRYIWFINGKAIHQERTLEIKPNEVIRFTFENKTMMHHPMHLHGHFFRVLNKSGENSPLKHTVDVPPHMSRTIEFYSDEPGEWMLHCHNLYHLKTGMARIVKYSSFTPKKEIKELQKHDPHMHDHLYYKGMIETATNHAQAELNLMNTWNELDLRTELRNDFNWQGEGDAFYKRWLNKWSSIIVGGTLVKQEGAAVAGLNYILPMLVETHTLIDHKGRMRLDLLKRFQWSKYIYTDAEFTFRQKQVSEFEISLMYQKDWAWSGGFMFTEHSAGVGLQFRF